MRIATAFVLASTLCAASAAAQDQAVEGASDEQTYDDGRLHFTFGDDLVVSVSQLRAPEGPVQVVTVAPVGSRGVDGASFVSFIAYEQAPQVAYLADVEPELRALDYTLERMVEALGDAAETTPEEVDIVLAGERLPGFRVDVASTRPATLEVTAMAGVDFSVLVYVDYRDSYDIPYDASLDQVVSTFGFGPAPTPDTNASTEESE